MKQNNKYAYYTRAENRKYWWQFWKPQYKYVERSALEIVDLKPKPQGSVIKANKTQEYTPEPRKGGRVTRAMPKPLKKLKEAQENSEVPTLPE